ncbi:MAG: hypothetical protein NTZ02_04020 [Candidatus Woesearchaeota archaeon]|nr:hypothetical protein [Candidatus Woesearchaeota archaeon]
MKKKHQFSISSLVSIIIILAFAVVLAEEATAVDLQNCGASASQLIAKFKSDGPNSYISDYQCAPCAKLLYDGTSNPYYCKFTDINGNPYCDACYNTTLSTYGKCKATAVPNQYQCIPCNGPTALTRFTQNTCTDYYGTHPDSCVGSDTLEQYCSSDSTTCLSKSLSCSDYNGVALHAHCDGGKCVCDSGYTDADGDKSNGCEHPACSDSDGGTARFVYGTCDDASLHVDTCSGNFVVEQYCDSTTHKCSSMQLDCTSYQGVALHAHCDGGKCVCDSGYIDENGNAADGCEKATSTCPSNSCDPANNGPNGAGCCSQTGYYHPEKYKDANGCEYCIKGYCETQPACGDECSSTSCCSNNNYCYLEKSNNNIM